ncbi:MAG: LamG domain-containing protein [Euryarchaeota archaeon]|nr:LamG domain-containing protein [Euryarchaeota archaeon]
MGKFHPWFALLAVSVLLAGCLEGRNQETSPQVRLIGSEVVIWSFDRTSTDATGLGDASGKGINLTNHGANMLPDGGRFRGGASLSGKETWLEAESHDFQTLSTITAMAWILPRTIKPVGGEQSGVGISGIINNVAAKDTKGGFALRIGDANQGAIEWLIYDDAPREYRLVANLTITGGAMSHVAGTFDGTTSSLYVNGLLVGARQAALTPSTSRLELGRDNYNPSRNLDGILDEVRIFDRALGQRDIITLMNCPYERGIADPNTGLAAC